MARRSSFLQLAKGRRPRSLLNLIAIGRYPGLLRPGLGPRSVAGAIELHLRASRSPIAATSGLPRTFLIAFALTASSCAFNQGNFLKQLQKLETAEYSRIQIGETQHFTAVKRRIFDKHLTLELSSTDDPGIQSRFSNQGDLVYYSDNTADVILRFASKPMPEGMDPFWDRFFVLDGAFHTEATNYVSPAEPKDFLASIIDNDSTVRYRDIGTDILLHRRPLQPDMHADYDALFVTDDDRYGIARSRAKGLYRFFFTSADTGQLQTFDFRPVAWGLQSIRAGTYLGVVYDLRNRQWRVVQFLPTQKLICFDLARAFEATAKAADHALSQAALRGILVALAGYSTATFSGVGQASYSGYYSGHSTIHYSGYAQVYDYRYLAAGAVNVLDAAFAGRAAVGEIEDAMRRQRCELEF